MLLNEFLKEHQRVEQLERKVQQQVVTIAKQREDLESTVRYEHEKFEERLAAQQKQIEALSATVHKVNDQMQMQLTSPSTRLVADNE